MTKTTAPKAPRLTKAQKAEALALGKKLAVTEPGDRLDVVQDFIAQDVPVVQSSLDEALTPEVIEQVADAMPESTWVDPIKWVDETPSLNDVMSTMPKTKVMKVVKTVKTGVGAQILQHIADGVLSNKEIVAKVLADNPLRKTTYACVAWYQSQVKAGKIDLPKPLEEVTEE